MSLVSLGPHSNRSKLVNRRWKQKSPPKEVGLTQLHQQVGEDYMGLNTTSVVEKRKEKKKTYFVF